MSEKVYVTSMIRGTVTVTIPQLNFKRTWTKKGMRIPIEREKLDEMIFDSGFEYMLRNGMLYIESLEVKKSLGLEPEDAIAPVNIIPLDEKTMKRLMGPMPASEFKKEIGKYSVEQCKDLADYAIANRLLDYEKCSVLKEITNIDVIKTCEFNRIEEEAQKINSTAPVVKSGQTQMTF